MPRSGSVLDEDLAIAPGDVELYQRPVREAVPVYRINGVTLAQLTQAIASANQNVGGQRIALGDQAYTVRGIA